MLAVWPLAALLRRNMPRLEALWRLRQDAADDDEQDLVDDMASSFSSDYATESRVLTTAKEISRSVDRASRITIQSVLGVDPFASEPWLAARLAAHAEETAALVSTIPDRYFGALSETIANGVASGARWEEIAARLQAKFLDYGGSESELGKAFRRAGTIARDQVGTLNSKLTQARFGEAGITSYRWRTALDERVRGNPGGKYPKARPSHWHREGKVFQIDDPPNADAYDGPPGTPPLCRCIAEPIIPGFDAGGDDEEEQ